MTEHIQKNSLEERKWTVFERRRAVAGEKKERKNANLPIVRWLDGRSVTVC